MKEILLTNGGAALVDDEDYEFLSGIRWNRITSKGRTYAVKCFWYKDEKKRRTLTMADFLLIGHEGDHIDHIDGDGLNNQKHNLRAATVAQNQWNSKKRVDNKSGFKGVSYSKGHKKYHAQIGLNGWRHTVGYFNSAAEAARAYDKAALRFYGEFAAINFPREDYL